MTRAMKESARERGYSGGEKVDRLCAAINEKAEAGSATQAEEAAGCTLIVPERLSGRSGVDQRALERDQAGV